MLKFFSKIMRILTKRLFVIAILILVQFLFIGLTIWAFSDNYVYVNAVLLAISIIVTLIIVNNNDDPGYKLAWAVSILLAPVFGGIL